MIARGSKANQCGTYRKEKGQRPLSNRSSIVLGSPCGQYRLPPLQDSATFRDEYRTTLSRGHNAANNMETCRWLEARAFLAPNFLQACLHAAPQNASLASSHCAPVSSPNNAHPRRTRQRMSQNALARRAISVGNYCHYGKSDKKLTL